MSKHQDKDQTNVEKAKPKDKAGKPGGNPGNKVGDMNGEASKTKK